MSERAMDVASLLLREGSLRRDDAEHQILYEELSKEPLLMDDVRRRVAAVGYTLVEELGHVGLRPSEEAEMAFTTRNRMGLNALHIRLIVYLWTQLVYREIIELRRNIQLHPLGQTNMFDSPDEDLYISHRTVLNDFSSNISSAHLKGAFSTLKRLRFIKLDEKHDRIYPDASLYVLVDRNRMEEFVMDLAQRLGSTSPGEAVARVVFGSAAPKNVPEENE